MFAFAMSFHAFSRLEDCNPLKLYLLEHFLSFVPFLDPDEKDIMFSDLETHGDWSRKGIPWLEGSNPSDQRTFKRHVFNVLSVDKYFHEEGMKIILGKMSAAFTHAAGLGSALRFADHVRWSAEIFFGSEKGCEFLSKELQPLPGHPALTDRMMKGNMRRPDAPGHLYEFPSIVLERQFKKKYILSKYEDPARSDLINLMLPEPENRTKPIFAFNNLSHIEIRWVCRRYEPIHASSGERGWHPSTTDDLKAIFSFLEIQLMAYPQAKTLNIDFIGWDYPDHATPVVPLRNRDLERTEPLTRFSGPLPELVLRGLTGQHQEKVIQFLSRFVAPNGRIGTTSSNFILVEGGTLLEIAKEKVLWRPVKQTQGLAQPPPVEDEMGTP